MPDEDGAALPTTVLFIGGTSRSGSTLLECLLARLPQVTVLGEVQHLWRRGILENQLCACGEPFASCEFWVSVGKAAFGGWNRVDVDKVLSLMDAVDRQRRMPSTARRHPGPAVQAALQEYSEYYRAIYDAAKQISGAEVVVDSSKVPPVALCLSHNGAIDLRVLHIVRDSRGVAFSWTKVVTRPETEGGEHMPRFGVGKSAGFWLSHNLSMSLLSYRGVPVARVKYEDVVDDAAATVGRAWSSLRLPGAGQLPMLDRSTIELRPTHSIAGNPMRFSLGTTTLAPDVAWRRSMRPRDKRLVTVLTYPVLRAMGYDGRSS